MTTSLSDFIPGAELARLFYEEVVAPILGAEFPALRWDAALIDAGSEVLGFDDAMSRDHHWGPRVTLYLAAADHRAHAQEIVELLRRRLPIAFRGYPTSFEPIPGEPRSLRFEYRKQGPVNHRVAVKVLRDEVRDYLGFDTDNELTATHWLTFPQQKLRTLTHGPVFALSLGEVDAMRERFLWYPRDAWLYLLAAGWMRISQEEPFIGRTGLAGDDIGSAIIAARLVRDVMQLCFLMERQYAPYAKWFGTAFAGLESADELIPVLRRALAADGWEKRAHALNEAFHILARMHNALSVTAPLSTEPAPFYSRPFQVIGGERFSSALVSAITDPAVKRIAAGRLIGSIDQFSDSTDLRESAGLRERLRALYER